MISVFVCLSVFGVFFWFSFCTLFIPKSSQLKSYRSCYKFLCDVLQAMKEIIDQNLEIAMLMMQLKDYHPGPSSSSSSSSKSTRCSSSSSSTIKRKRVRFSDDCTMNFTILEVSPDAEIMLPRKNNNDHYHPRYRHQALKRTKTCPY